MAEKNRPNENCVERISDAMSSVRMTMIEPVRLRESERRLARTTPRYPPAPFDGPTLPSASASSALTQANSSAAPTSFV